MDPAWIAVIGTVSGVGVTAASSAISALLMTRHQRAVAEMQITATSRDNSRQELRQAFVDYLAAYSALRDRAIVLYEQRAAESEQDGSVGPPMEEFASEEATQFKRAHHTLQIMANDVTSEAAFAVTFQLWDMVKVARGLDPGPWAREMEESLPLRRKLYAAMREQLHGPSAHPE
ncbi:hypothetical protein [Nocardia beijingensis]